MRLCRIILLLGISVPAAAWANDPPSAASVLLIWTTPGDNGQSGTAARYDLRYSRLPITPSNFNNATPVSFVPSPGQGGSMTQVIVNGLSPGMGYFFALKTADERPNWSSLSNVAYWDGGTTAVQTIGPSVEMSQVWPNPARGSTQFTLTMAYEDDVQIEIFDVTGRRVRILVDGVMASGSREFQWNFRDDFGHRLERGVYLMRARIGRTTFSRRIVAAE